MANRALCFLITMTIAFRLALPALAKTPVPPTTQATSVAVLPFSNQLTSAENRVPQLTAQAETAAEEALFLQFGNIRVIERSKIKQLLTESAFGQSGLTQPATKIGTLLNADYVLLGSVDSGKFKEVRSKSMASTVSGSAPEIVRPLVTTTIAMTVKLVNVHTGEIVAIEKSSGWAAQRYYQGPLLGLYVRAAERAARSGVVSLADGIRAANGPPEFKNLRNYSLKDEYIDDQQEIDAFNQTQQEIETTRRSQPLSTSSNTQASTKPPTLDAASILILIVAGAIAVGALVFLYTLLPESVREAMASGGKTSANKPAAIAESRGVSASECPPTTSDTTIVTGSAFRLPFGFGMSF